MGLSVITDWENHLFKLPSSFSIYTAETHAIYQALSIISTSNSTNCHIIISDSLSALTAISNSYPKNELIQHIQKLISKINTPICFMCVPSHIGIPGNEKSDTSDYEAITSPQSIKISSTSSFEIFGIIHQKKNGRMATFLGKYSPYQQTEKYKTTRQETKLPSRHENKRRSNSHLSQNRSFLLNPCASHQKRTSTHMWHLQRNSINWTYRNHLPQIHWSTQDTPKSSFIKPSKMKTQLQSVHFFSI